MLKYLIFLIILLKFVYGQNLSNNTDLQHNDIDIELESDNSLYLPYYVLFNPFYVLGYLFYYLIIFNF